MRVLVTGSRDWPYPEVVDTELFNIHGDTDELMIVHGACPGGADQMAADWIRCNQSSVPPITEERHPADWNKHGKAAGPIRNQEMVDAGADLCLAFILNGSRGASHCLERARCASIPARVIELHVNEFRSSYE